MKGKIRFTRSDIEKIKNLTRRKLSASSSEQKQIRNRIRSIGFYYSDFSNSKGYDVADIDVLIKNGAIKIISEKENVIDLNPTADHVIDSIQTKTSEKSKMKKPIIVDDPKYLFEPIYGLDPLIDDNVKYLIVGTFPAKESIQGNFYYQNQSKRFWGQALRTFGELQYKTNLERKDTLLKNHIGLWDIFKCVQRKGGNQDSAIEKAAYNSLENLINTHPSISHIIFNGNNAKIWLEDDYPNIFKDTKIKYLRLQSTSGLNGWFNDGKDWNDFFHSVF